MRKLFVGVLIAIFGLMVIAGTTDIQANWTIKWMKFIFVLDEKGIDLKQSAKYLVTWNLGDSSKNGKVTASFSWGFNGAKWYYSLDSITFNGNILDLSYSNSSAYVDKYIFVGVGSDSISVSFKALSGLTIYYADLLEETNPDNVDNVPANSFFDDAVLAEYSQGLGTLNLKVAAGFYDAEATNTDASNDYEFAGIAYLDGVKNSALEGLSVKVAGGKLVSGDTAYGIIARYSMDMNMGNLSINLSPTFKYVENLTQLKFATTYPPNRREIADAKYASVGVDLSVNISPLSLEVYTQPRYDIEGGEFSAYTDLNVGVDIKPVSAGVEFEIYDAVKFENGWMLRANAGVDLSPISLNANFWYADDSTNAYNATLAYTIEEGLTAKAFYGTLYDSDGNGVPEMHPDAPQWWLKVCYSL